MNYLNNSDPKRFGGLGNVLTNRGFWEVVKENWISEMISLNLVDKYGNPIIINARGGPGYLNCTLSGGVGKINYITGVLNIPNTKYKTIITIGDSITDHAETPPILKVLLSKDLSNDIREIFPYKAISDDLLLHIDKSNGRYKGLMEQGDELTGKIKLEFFGKMDDNTYEKLIELKPNDLYWENIVKKLKESSIAFYDEALPINIVKKIKLVKDNDRLILTFEGYMSDSEYLILKSLIKGIFWENALDELKKSSDNIYKHRLVFKFLLSDLLEMDALERVKAMQAGIIRTEYFFSSLNPFGDSYDVERWGPAVYFSIISAIQKVAEQGGIYAYDNMFKVRDALLRKMIIQLRKNYTKHFYLYSTLTMNPTNSYFKNEIYYKK